MEKEINKSISYVYDTLDPLVFSSEHDLDVSGSYSVYRSEVTTSANLAAYTPVSEYFSLDVSADSTCCDLDESPALPSPVSAPCSPEATRPAANESAWFRPGSLFRSPMLQLHKEIVDFSEFLSPTPEEQSKRTAAVDRIFHVVKYIWPHCRVEVFGSFRTGLYLPTSDIDAVILNSKVKTPQTGLYALARALSQKGLAKKMQVIAKARVPIVKFVEKLSGIAFDISFDMDSGPKAAIFIKDIVEKLPPLRYLCLILKVFLQQRELNEVYSGGVGSYALLAMLIAHLQIHWRSQDMKELQKSMEHNLGILLVKFFEFYGRKLNTFDVGVSCNSSNTFFLKCDKGFLNAGRPFLLSIQDPQDPDNDIGKNSFNYYKVKSAFAMAYSSLTDGRAITSLGSQKSILGTIIRPDPALLDRKGGSNGELTFSKLLPGAGESAPQQCGFDKDVIYNWQLVDDEPLPRDIIFNDDNSALVRKPRALGTKHKSNKIERNSSSCGNSAKKRRVRDRDCYAQNNLPHCFS